MLLAELLQRMMCCSFAAWRSRSQGLLISCCRIGI
ncbi:MAG: hypothetical protein ACJAZW_003153, partial [Maritalea sp.]